MSIQYVPDCNACTALDDALRQGFASANTLEKKVNQFEEDLTDNKYDQLAPDISDLQAYLDNLANNPVLSPIVAKLKQLIDTTCSHYQIVSKDGSVRIDLSQSNAIMDTDITSDYDQYPSGIPPYGAAYMIDCNQETYDYVEKGITYRVTRAIDRRTGKWKTTQLFIIRGTAQQAVDSGSASIQQITGTDGLGDLNAAMQQYYI